MRLGDVKNVMSYKPRYKLILQVKVIVLGSSYFSYVIILSPSLVAASISIVCGRCAAHLMVMVRIIDRRANALSSYKMSFVLVYD